MKIFATILLAVACVHANSTLRYGWAPGTESLFRFESQVLTGIPDIQNSQYAGLKLMAQVRVQAFPDYTLRVKLEQPRFITFNGEISLTEARRIIGTGGARSGAKEQLPQEFRRFLEEPMLVHLKRGLVESFFVSQDEPVAITNIKRSLLSQLQLDVTGIQRFETETNRLDLGQGAQQDVEIPYYKVVEESLHGKCHTMYNVFPITSAKALELEQAWEEEENKAQLTPSFQGKAACEGKKYFEIVKTRDLDHCHFSPAFQKVSGADTNGDVTKSHVGDLMTHMVSSATYVCGSLSAFNIRKIVVDDTIVNNPIGHNTDQGLRTTTRIMIELLKKESISSRLPVPSQTRKETSLVYAYPEQRALSNQMSAKVVQKTQQILGIVPVLPQPGLTEAPKSLIPVQLPKQEIITKVVEQIRRVAREVFESPESCSSKHDISGKLLTVSKYMQVLSFSDLEEVWAKALAGTTGTNRQATKDMVVDAVAMVGTNPATMVILKKIEIGDISPIRATAVIQSALKSIRTPTKELLREFVKLIRQWKNVNASEKKQLLTSTLFQLSNLFYRAYVNPSTMMSNYPVRIYGIFGTKDSRVLINEYIPLLTEMLGEFKQSQNKHMELVVIASLGKLGHYDAAKHLIKVAQGIQQEEPMVRSLAVYSMKRMAKRYPTEMKAVLLAIINNPVEHADVRVAAVAVLPWAQPSYAELQKIAVRSWYDPSEQVSAFARSTFESLLYTEVPELKPIGAKLKGIMHMFKPTHYGLQYSKNIHISKFVRYLLTSVSTKVAYTMPKSDLAPSKIALTTDLYLQALGSGLKFNLNSFSAYAQGVESAIDFTLKFAGDFLKVKQPVKDELIKIADEINLQTRIPPKFMAFVQQRTMGFEYAGFFNYELVMQMTEKLGEAMDNGNLQSGLEWAHVGAVNLASVEVYGQTEAGFPVFAEVDLPSTVAATGSVKFNPSAQWMVSANLMPVWNTKFQSNYGIISPFTEEIVGTGVTMAFHTSAPVETLISMRKGELDIAFKTPEATLQKGKNLEIIHGFIMPYTARKYIRSVEPFNKAQDLKKILTGEPVKRTTKQFHGLINGEFSAESDNEFVDFYSYWEKIKQNNLPSLMAVGPLMSSVRMSSARLSINPSMSELKEVTLKFKLYTRKASWVMQKMSTPIDQALESEIETKGLTLLKKSLSLLHGAPTTILKLEASLKERSAAKTVEVFTALGYKPISGHHVKSTAAAGIKLPHGKTYGFLYEGELQMPKFLARWTKEKVLQQPLELFYNGEVVYGVEGDQNSQKKIVLKSVLKKSQSQIRAVRESEEFKKCAIEATAGRRLSPICLKVRHQAGSLDKAEVTLQFPREFYTSPIFNTLEQMIKAQFVAHYKPIVPVPQLSLGVVKLEFDWARAGDVAQVKVEHKNDAYKLENIRIPYIVQGVMPLCARNRLYDWLEQKATMNRAPASCRVEPEILTTFDNKTYGYKINDCEHVLMMDGSRTLPVAVLTRTVSGITKMVKILSGESKIEIVPESGSLKVKLDGRMETIRPGQTFYEKSTKTGNIIVEIRHYQDGVYYVYVPNQLLHVLTDGVSIEIIAPQLLRGRAVGLCGDLNGEVAADLQSPRKCVMKPKLAAMSYMLNKQGSSASSYGARCAGIPSADLPEYKHEEQVCVKERIIPTPIIPIFERLQSLNKPVVSAHMVEKQRNQICITKEKINICSGQSDVSRQGMVRSNPFAMKPKMVEYACVAAPSSKAQSLEKRAKSGESLSMELSSIPTAFSKMEAEPIVCGAEQSTGIIPECSPKCVAPKVCLWGVCIDAPFSGSNIGGGSRSWEISRNGGRGSSSSGSGMRGGNGGSGIGGGNGGSGMGGGYGSSEGFNAGSGMGGAYGGSGMGGGRAQSGSGSGMRGGNSGSGIGGGNGGSGNGGGYGSSGDVNVDSGMGGGYGGSGMGGGRARSGSFSGNEGSSSTHGSW